MNVRASTLQAYRKARVNCLFALPALLAMVWASCVIPSSAIRAFTIVAVLAHVAMCYSAFLLYKLTQKLKPMGTPEMTCDWCGKSFPANPNCCLEGGVSMELPEGDEWKFDGMTVEDISPQERQNIMQAMGIDECQLKTLIETGEVNGMGHIVCEECQEKGLNQTEDDQ